MLYFYNHAAMQTIAFSLSQCMYGRSHIVDSPLAETLPDEPPEPRTEQVRGER